MIAGSPLRVSVSGYGTVQAECERARESARREARAGDTELENLRERLSR